MTDHDIPLDPQGVEKLLPCPFCGGEAEFERRGTGRQSCIVACSECGARHESGDTFNSGASWNRRHAQPRAGGTAEDVERERRKIVELTEMAKPWALDEAEHLSRILAALTAAPVPSAYVKWSDEDGEWVAVHPTHPGVSWLAKTPQEALDGLVNVLADLVTAPALTREQEDEVIRRRVEESTDDEGFVNGDFAPSYVLSLLNVPTREEATDASA